MRCRPRAGVRFYRAVSVVDPDDARKAYGFDLDGHPAHGACFHVGAGPDGTPLISWSDLRALYQLSDGSKWAEHGFFHDAEDLVRARFGHLLALDNSHS